MSSIVTFGFPVVLYLVRRQWKLTAVSFVVHFSIVWDKPVHRGAVILDVAMVSKTYLTNHSADLCQAI